MQVQLVPTKLFHDVMQKAVVTSLISANDVQKLPKLQNERNRTYRIEENGRITSLCSYCPNYLVNTQFKYKNHVHCIEVFIFRGNIKVLRPAIVQAYYKQIPILLHDKNNETAIQKYVTVEKDMHIIDVDQVKQLFDQFPSEMIDKSGSKFDILQVDQRHEFNTIALLMMQAFMDDPIFNCIMPLHGRRENLLYDIVYFIAETTSFRGMNWLLVNSLSLLDTKAGLLASPAGLEHGHWGPTMQQIPLLMKYVNLCDMGCMANLDKIHQTACGASDNHLYVAFISTVFNYKSAGLGSLIMREVNQIADQTDSFVYLENSKEKNLEFYQKQGLQVKTKIYIDNSLSNSHATAWVMRRSNKSRQQENVRYEEHHITFQKIKEK